MPDDITVLMTGAGAPGASGILRSLRGVDERTVEVVGVDMDPKAYGFSLVNRSYTVPEGRDEAYLPRLSEIVAAEEVDVVLPLTTAELDPLSRIRDEWAAEGVATMVSEPDALAVANDKGRLYAYLHDRGLDPAPVFRVVDSLDAFVGAVEAFGYPESPVCFKRPVASGSRGFRVLDGSADRLDRLLNHKPDTTLATLEDVRSILEQADPFPELVVMEYLPGDEYSVDVLAMGDEVGPVVPRSRSRTRAGISFQGTVERDEDLIDAASEICRNLGLEFNVNLQFRFDAEGTPKLIEINPRVSGTIVMCVGAGVNLPYLGVKFALSEPLPEVSVAWGTRMRRYWEEAFTAPDGTTFTLNRGEVDPPRVR